MPEKLKDPHAVDMGKRGGKARARKLSKERRREIAKLGYAAGLGKKLGQKKLNFLFEHLTLSASLTHPMSEETQQIEGQEATPVEVRSQETAIKADCSKSWVSQ